MKIEWINNKMVIKIPSGYFPSFAIKSIIGSLKELENEAKGKRLKRGNRKDTL